jgi:hypothetical protein
MLTKLYEISEKTLPWVNENRQRDFCDGMHAFYTKFKEYGGESIHYQDNSDYQNELFLILELDLHECWIYSPQFKKAVARMIGELFRTTISQVSIVSPVDRDQPVFFIDDHGFRWAMLVDYHCPTENPDKLRVGMRFPRNCSKKPCTLLETLSQNSVIDPNDQHSLFVIDASNWLQHD